MTSVNQEPADIVTSSDDYASRFAGPTGEWMLDLQARITLDLLKPLKPESILDVGGGHGQLAGPVLNTGYPVTVLGSTPECADRLKPLEGKEGFTFVTGSVTDLPFPDDSFDVVMCFRLVCHCDQWPHLLSELCRVARKGVIIDYPTTQSVNIFSSALFELKKGVEKNTRPYELFSHRAINNEFAKIGFNRTNLAKQFFFPMALHRMLKSLPVSRGLEGTSRVLGLTALLGSPVIGLWTSQS